LPIVQPPWLPPGAVELLAEPLPGVTNPPYGPARGLAARFVAHALTRIRPGGSVCMLLRTNWEAPQGHVHLMARCCRKYTFSRRLKMHRGGYTGKKHSPQLDVSWYVFSNEHDGPTQTVVLPPDCGEEATKFATPTIAAVAHARQHEILAGQSPGRLEKRK
jgi:hypothetical protein